MMLVAVLGTTISPYLFFWQASQEVEDMRLTRRRRASDTPADVNAHLRRHQLDTIVGMIFSNVIAFFVMLTPRSTLHAAGITDIQTVGAGRRGAPPAGRRFRLRAVRARHHRHRAARGAGAGAVGRLCGDRGLRLAPGPRPPGARRKGFYAIIVAATLVGTALDFSPIDPIKALFWSAVINGVIAVPIMVAMMLLSGKPEVMGLLPVNRKTRLFGWGAVAAMAVAVVMMGRDLLC